MSHNNKCTHDDNRKKVCAPCGKKIVLSYKSSVVINDNLEKLIQKFLWSHFNQNDKRYPLAICGSCRLTLREYDKEIYNRQLPSMPNYTDIILQGTARSLESCNCYICLTARSSVHFKTQKGRGKFRNISNKIDTSKRSESPKVESSSLVIPSKKCQDQLHLCAKCLQQIGRGLRHECKTSPDNLMKIIEKLPEKTQEQVATRLIKKKCSRGDGIANLDMSTSGRKMRIAVNPHADQKVGFEESRLDNLRVTLACSSNQMRTITKFLRTSTGRFSVPKDYLKHTSEQSRVLADVYKVDLFELECESKANISKELRPVVFANAGELLEAVIDNRKLEGNFLIKVMADGGQGFFKISMTILPENYSLGHYDDYGPIPEQGSSSSVRCEELGKRKSSSYSVEGGKVSKRGKLTSVDKLIMVCLVPRIKESYENMKLLFELTKLNDIPFKFVADFKLLLIINGQQTATSTYPCPYCYISLGSLRGSSTAPYTDNTSSGDDLGVEVRPKSRTFGSLTADYEKYRLAGEKKKFSKDSYSTVNPPLISEEDHTCVLKKCIIPELHILQGFVNHLFWQGLVKLVGEEKALLWPKKLNLISKNYHGNGFEGNACRKLLIEADKLNDPQIYKDVGIFKIIPYIAAFKAMNKVVTCSFTSGEVDPLVGDRLKELRGCLDSIENLSRTLKIHVLLDHLEECLSYIDNNMGLGFWSEQSGEAIHHNFQKFWSRYKVTDIHHPTYSTNLLKAVVEFSSLHL